MKRGLLLCTLLALTLGACGNNGGSSIDITSRVNFSDSISYYDIDVYIQNARDDLEYNCMYLADHMDDEEIVQCIWDFCDQENEYLDSINDVMEAYSAIDTIRNHEKEYVVSTLGPILNAKLNEMAEPLLACIEETRALNAAIAYVDSLKNKIVSGIYNFRDLFFEYERFVFELEDKIIEIVRNNGGEWNDDIYQDYIEGIYSYARELEYLVEEYLPLDLHIYIDESISRLYEYETVDELDAIYDEIRAGMYAIALSQIKELLIEFYTDLIDRIDKAITNYDVKKEVIATRDSEPEAINKLNDINDVILEYEMSINRSKSNVIEGTKQWGYEALDDVYWIYIICIRNDDESSHDKYLNLYRKYSNQIFGADDDFDTIEGTVKRLVDEFDSESYDFMTNLYNN